MATAGAGSATVTWQRPQSNGGATIDRYRVVRTSVGEPTTTSNLAAQRRSLTVNGLIPGRTYSFRVRAHNARGWGPFSRTVSAVPNARAGFGTILGTCGAVAPQLDDATPSLFGDRTFDFGADPYDEPADRTRLTEGGQKILEVPNAGGSAVFSEVFAFEALARCEGAILLKTESEIVYDQAGKRADLLVQIAGRKVGVSVMRASTFPFGSPPVLTNLATLLERKLDDIVASTQNVAAEDEWVKQVLVVMAYDQQHADTIEQAWASLDAATRADTIVYVVVTDGSDTNIYGNS